jgi:hypothetical protein
VSRRRVPYGVALKAATEAGLDGAGWSLWALPAALVAATWWWIIGLPAMKCPACSAALEPEWSACVACGQVVRAVDEEPVVPAEPLPSASAPDPASTIDEAALDQLWDQRTRGWGSSPSAERDLRF